MMPHVRVIASRSELPAEVHVNETSTILPSVF